MNLVEVIIWNKLVGVLVWDNKKQRCRFEFSEKFIQSGLELSPFIHLISSEILEINKTHNEDEIIFDSNKGLPLFISDSLPDKFGTALFVKYLEKEGKNYRDLNPLEKLTYIGDRGMGALEFRPAKNQEQKNNTLNLNELYRISKSLINNKPIAHINNLNNLFHVGTSPGGAQPKVLINIDKNNGEIYRGDLLPTKSQESWLLKFNKDIGLESDIERGKIEYAYYIIAKNAGIHMMHSELKEFENEFYFMTKRFDRINEEKLHTQTLHAFAGMNFKLPNTYSYEQIFSVLNKLNLEYYYKEQLFRTMVFNIIGRNVDDHTKNFGFNMNKNGHWKMSPAYDLTFSYNENYGRITPHFLSVNGKNENHLVKDILTIANEYGIKKPKKIFKQINQSFLDFKNISEELNISEKTINYILSKLKTTPYHLK